MTDCWLDPYGNIYECPRFGHGNVAEEILQDEFPINDFRSWADNPNFHMSYDETLQRRGWVRFSSTVNRWSCENCSDFEEHYPRPTSIQRDRMFELTGYIYGNPESYSVRTLEGNEWTN